MLIGFSGASGSGKTTLVRELAEKLNCGVVEEVAREVFKEWRQRYGFQSLAEIRMYSPTKFQLEVFREQTRREDEELEKHEVVLTDRTIYDNLFFTLFYHDDAKLLNRYLREFRRREKEKRYNLIFFCELLDANVNDGFRTADLPYRKVQEFAIRRLIPFKTFWIPATSVEKRVELFIDIIRRCQNAD